MKLKVLCFLGCLSVFCYGDNRFRKFQWALPSDLNDWFLSWDKECRQFYCPSLDPSQNNTCDQMNLNLNCAYVNETVYKPVFVQSVFKNMWQTCMYQSGMMNPGYTLPKSYAATFEDQIACGWVKALNATVNNNIQNDDINQRVFGDAITKGQLVCEKAMNLTPSDETHEMDINKCIIANVWDNIEKGVPLNQLLWQLKISYSDPQYVDYFYMLDTMYFISINKEKATMMNSVLNFLNDCYPETSTTAPPRNRFNYPGVNKYPGPNGYNRNPGPNSYNTNPGQNGYNTNPGPNSYSRNPGQNGYNTNPGPNGHRTNPGPTSHSKKNFGGGARPQSAPNQYHPMNNQPGKRETPLSARNIPEAPLNREARSVTSNITSNETTTTATLPLGFQPVDDYVQVKMDAINCAVEKASNGQQFDYDYSKSKSPPGRAKTYKANSAEGDYEDQRADKASNARMIEIHWMIQSCIGIGAVIGLSGRGMME